MNSSTSIAAAHHPLPRTRQRAAAIVLREDGRVLLHRPERDAFWALPGGAIEPGESAAQAIAREFQEELDTSIALGDLAFVVENFFCYAGVEYHEIGLYLRAGPLPGSLLSVSAGPYEGVEGDQKLVFAWFDLEKVADLDLRPAFLRSALMQGAMGVQHIVHRDES